MSELEKRQRDEYQQNRKRLISIQMIVAAALVLVTLLTLIPYIAMHQNTYVYYAEDGRVDAKVYLSDNSFYDQEYLGNEHAYLAELIRHIETRFVYGLVMDDEGVDYKYSYKIEAAVNVTDRDSNAPIYDPVFLLSEMKDAKAPNNKKLSISQRLNINYAEYNKMAQDFVDAYGVQRYSAELTVRMHVSVLGESESFAENKSNSYTMEYRIPLLKQVVKLTTQSSVPTGEQRILACDSAAKVVLLVLWIVFAVLSVLAGIFILCFVILTRDKHIDYTRRVQKLLSNYKSYIQRVGNSLDFESYKILRVMTFEELLEIGDKLQNPVLMYENEDKTKSDFFISTCNDLLYLYTVEVEDDELPEMMFVPEDESVFEKTAPEEIASEETVLAEEIVSETCAIPEEEIVVPAVEEPAPVLPEGEVEAIDIKWNEDDRTYRYDPNGEVVDEGDIVLVPTMLANIGEIQREAQVARGNYRVPADELKAPLKKIIAVVRRKMQSLVAPSGEDTQE